MHEGRRRCPGRFTSKIAAINAEDWARYLLDGNIVKGNEAHIGFPDPWFKSSDNHTHIVNTDDPAEAHQAPI